MNTFRAELQNTIVDDWIAEDQFGSVLSDQSPIELADDALAKEMLDQTMIDLPQALDWCELDSSDLQHKTAGGFTMPANPGLGPILLTLLDRNLRDMRLPAAFVPGKETRL